MWKAKNKIDLMIEVWEKLDCETVGRSEIEAIEVAVEDVFGRPAVESPMRIARLLADEGAELRHSEIMELYLERASDRPHDALFVNLIDTQTLESALRSLRQMENLRRKLEKDRDARGLRLLRENAIGEKDKQLARAVKKSLATEQQLAAGEIAEWFRLWLQSPELFESWIGLRQRSEAYRNAFGEPVTEK